MSPRLLSYSILVVGTSATIVALALAGEGFGSLLNGFTLWAVLPYATLAAAVAIARTRGGAMAALAVCFLAVGFAVYGYTGLFVGHQSSTAGLIFVSLPLYQLLAAVIVLTFAAERRRYANDI